MENKANDFFEIDDSARKYLQNELGVSVTNSSGMKRTATNFNRSFLSSKLDRTGP